MKTRIIFAFACLFSVCVPLRAQDNITDSVDALHYDLRLDIGNRTARQIEGSAAVTMRIVSQIDTLSLELCQSDIDSVLLDGAAVPFLYRAAQRRLNVPFAGHAGDTVTMTVFYRKGEQQMPQGWGGFYFSNNVYYNLGIALYEYPHNAGKAWFPCRDNFYDHASYHFEITAQPGWKAICTGLLDTVVPLADGGSTWVWNLQRPTVTYLAGVAVAPFHIIERQYDGQYGTYPALLGFLSHDSVSVWRAYDNMSRVIPMLERRFGPYRWDRVGYVSTPKGSMEHVGNVAFISACMASQGEACLATMSHEFAHSWFGNLVTCASSLDMWINEGGASFCEEVALEAIYADSDPLRYKDFAKEHLCEVLNSAHIDDGGFKPVWGQTPDYTYGTTVYRKGAAVWHSLRGYMGDSLFYSSMQTLFDRHAFKNIDSRQLCDSLSLYSGIDLRDFFEAHVFRAGFIDYVIDSVRNDNSSTAVYLRQKTYGTDTMANGNRVWVTFFSADRTQRADRLVTFDGERTEAVFQLPFLPQYAFVDYDGAMSLASIGQQFVATERSNHELTAALFRSDVTSVGDGDSVWLYVRHHWTRPDTSLSGRFLRMADRYWDVAGSIPDGSRASGRFFYSRSGDSRTLDEELFGNADEFGHVRLLYREGTGSEWTVVSSIHTGNSSQGYFVLNNLKLGQYTLALMDTGYVDVVQPDANGLGSNAVRVFPNPSAGTVTVETAFPGEALTIDICDAGGRTVVKGLSAKSGEQIRLDLKQGVYVFNIRSLETNGLSGVKVGIMNF